MFTINPTDTELEPHFELISSLYMSLGDLFYFNMYYMLFVINNTSLFPRVAENISKGMMIYNKYIIIPLM